VDGANHFFEDKVDDLQKLVSDYLDKRLGPNAEAPPRAARGKRR
jgi:hypothetical protein